MGPFPLATSKTRDVYKYCHFSYNPLTNHRSYVCVLLWLFIAFYSLSFLCYLQKVRHRHCEKQARRSYLQPTWMSYNKVPIMVTIWLSCSLDKTQVIFWNNLRNSEIKKKNGTVHHSSYLQVFNHAITILGRQIFPSGIEPVPAFSLSYVRRKETFVNLCHINVPKG